ncbi:MFS-type transporter SLC18B1 [Trichoplax sp. H2]|nr:MFS-type transporter SLC18B1 [Trichoplax sp. H2]|eukprot:RDD42101.1 MFS-type transporter SLC18B1 [Trichoplax sp. H2]
MEPDKTQLPGYRMLTTVFLCLLSLIAQSLYSLLVPFFATEVIKKGLSLNEIGFVYAVYPLAMFISSPIFGLMVPSIGSRYMIWAGLTIEGGCSILFGFLNWISDKKIFLILAIILRFVQGLGAACYITAAYSIVASLFRQSIATTMGVIETFSSLGYAIGPPIGGVLFTVGGFILPFTIVGSFMVGMAPIVAYFIPVSKDESVSTTKIMKKFCKIPYVYLICIAVCLGIMTLTFLEINYSIHIKKLNLTYLQIGMVFLIPAGTYALIAIMTGMAADRYGYRQFVVAGLIIMAISLQLLAPAPYWKIPLNMRLVVIGLIIYAIGTNFLFMPSFAELLSVAANKNIGDNLATYSVGSGLFKAAQALGLIIGPIVGEALIAVPKLGFPWTSSLLGYILFAHRLQLFSVATFKAIKLITTECLTLSKWALVISCYLLYEKCKSKRKLQSDEIDDETRQTLLKQKITKETSGDVTYSTSDSTEYVSKATNAMEK